MGTLDPAVYVNSTTEKITQHRQASVVGQAIAGGIIAGGVGAVVGAANATSKNASGGVQTTVGLRNYYFLSSLNGGRMIDTIYISTSVINQFGEPPKEFVVEKRQDF